MIDEHKYITSNVNYRAAAYSKLNKHVKAIEDCEKALAIDPQYSKAYGRMGFQSSRKIFCSPVLNLVLFNLLYSSFLKI
jgi:tetratricopeptide (TPR) repeat protein